MGDVTVRRKWRKWTQFNQISSVSVLIIIIFSPFGGAAAAARGMDFFLLRTNRTGSGKGIPYGDDNNNNELEEENENLFTAAACESSPQQQQEQQLRWLDIYYHNPSTFIFILLKRNGHFVQTSPQLIDFTASIIQFVQRVVPLFVGFGYGILSVKHVLVFPNGSLHGTHFGLKLLDLEPQRLLCCCCSWHWGGCVLLLFCLNIFFIDI